MTIDEHDVGESKGQLILAGLRDARAGNWAAVTIAGEHWIRSDAHDALVKALREMVYRTTSLSQEEDDGSHWCRIPKDVLETARAALAQAATQ